MVSLYRGGCQLDWMVKGVDAAYQMFSTSPTTELRLLVEDWGTVEVEEGIDLLSGTRT